MAKPKPPECPKCKSDKIVVATDKSNKHYCQKCNHVWVPGVDAMKREDLALAHYKKENLALTSEIDALRKENLALKDELKDLRGEPANTEDEIFT